MKKILLFLLFFLTTLSMVSGGFYENKAYVQEESALLKGVDYYFKEENFSTKDNYTGNVHIKYLDKYSNPTTQATVGLIEDGTLFFKVQVPDEMDQGTYDIIIEFEDPEEDLCMGRTEVTNILIQEDIQRPTGSIIAYPSFMETYEKYKVKFVMDVFWAYTGTVTLELVSEDGITFAKENVKVELHRGEQKEYYATFDLITQEGKPNGTYYINLISEGRVLDSRKTYISNNPIPVNKNLMRNIGILGVIVAVIIGAYLAKGRVLDWGEGTSNKEGKNLDIEFYYRGR